MNRRGKLESGGVLLRSYETKKYLERGGKVNETEVEVRKNGKVKMSL